MFRGPASGVWRVAENDVERAVKALQGKHERVERLQAYYDGEAGVPLISQRLKEVYQNQLCELSENWAAVVIDSCADRIELEALEGPDEATTARLAELADATDLLIEADDTHQAALITGESYVIAWKADEGSEVECYTQEPDACEVFYRSDRPNAVDFAAKWHDDGSDRVLTLYRPETIEIWTASKEKISQAGDDGSGRGWKAFERQESGSNPFAQIPVFHFRPQRRAARSDLHNILPLQDAVNILLTNMIVAAEFGAFPQKYILTEAEMPKRLRSEPGRVWELPFESKVGQFDSADLSHFISSIDHLVNALAIISRTPRHYFYGGQDAPSGEALRVMEAPLIKKCKDRIARFTPTWRQLAAFLYRLDTDTEIEPRLIRPRFADPATIQPLSDAQARKARAEAIEVETSVGLSKKRALMGLGYSEDEALAIIAERGAEQTSLGNELLRQFDAGAGAVGGQ